MTTISVTEARASLPELLDGVALGDEVTITRHGQPVAVLVRPDALRARRAGPATAEAARLALLLETARSRPLPKRGALTSERGDELVAAVKAGRTSR